MSQTYNLSVSGMHCAGCGLAIEDRISKMKGVKDVKVSYQQNTIKIVSDRKLSITALNKPLSDTGYKITEGGSTLPIIKTIKKYSPILVILLMVTAFSLFNEAILKPTFLISNFLNTYMAVFFLVFSAFKLVNLTGFANSFSQYDPIAKRSKLYAYSYPFIELVLGLMFATSTLIMLANVVTIIVMGVGTVGVVSALRSKKTIVCACLGGFFNLPMSYVTLFENLTMIAMAFIMLLFF